MQKGSGETVSLKIYRHHHTQKEKKLKNQAITSHTLLSKSGVILPNLQGRRVCIERERELIHCWCNLHSLMGGLHAHALGGTCDRRLSATVLFYRPVSIRVITSSKVPRT